MSDLKAQGYAPGSYLCSCTTCGKRFMGGKHAVTCRLCAEWWRDNPPPAATPEQQPMSQEERERRKALLREQAGRGGIFSSLTPEQQARMAEGDSQPEADGEA